MVNHDGRAQLGNGAEPTVKVLQSTPARGLEYRANRRVMPLEALDNPRRVVASMIQAMVPGPCNGARAAITGGAAVFQTYPYFNAAKLCRFHLLTARRRTLSSIMNNRRAPHRRQAAAHVITR